jgi:hypothetical protein
MLGGWKAGKLKTLIGHRLAQIHTGYLSKCITKDQNGQEAGKL